MSDRTHSTVTLSLRAKPTQAEQIRVAAMAANLSVSEYLYRRVTGKPILSTPALAALAELVATLRRLEVESGKASPTTDFLQLEILRLCRAICDLGELT